MRNFFRVAGLALAVSLLIGTGARAQAPALDGLTGFKTKAELDALVAKYQSGELKKGLFLFGRSHGTYHAGVNAITKGRHVPEVHTDKDEFFVVLGGSATMTIGGQLTDAKPKSLDPSEVRGTGISGGKSQKIEPGDIISVPHGTPHVMDPGDGQVVYLDITMFNQERPPAAKLTLNDLPESIRTQVLAVKNAKIESIRKASAGFNVDLETADGKSKEYLFNPAGKILALEDQVDFATLSPAVQAGLKQAAGKGQIGKVEAVDLLDLPRYYVAAVTLDGAKSEVRVSTNGGPVKGSN